jgi:hypothetical protein
MSHDPDHLRSPHRWVGFLGYSLPWVGTESQIPHPVATMANGTRFPYRALCGAQLAYTMIVRVETGWDRWALLLLCHRVTGYMVRSHAEGQMHFGSPVQGLRVEHPR